MMLRGYQERLVKRAVKALKAHGNTMAVAATGAGKCLGAGTPVLMFDGTIKNVEDVKVGDLLMGPDSTLRRVKSLARGREEMFRVVPIKGEPFVVNKSHILSLVVSGQRPVCGHMNGKVVNISVSEYLGMPKTFRHCAKGWRTGVDFQEKNTRLLIPPYILGVWLGDGGNVNENGFANPDREVIDEIVAYADCIGMRVRHHYDGDKCPMHFITTGERSPRANNFKRALRALSLPGNKHVPYAYKTASRRERLEVLAGLMDTDGHQTHGGYDFITKDKALAEDVAFIARSLGLAAYVKESLKRAQSMAEPGLYYRVSISGDCSVIPCRIERKKAAPRAQKKDALRFGFCLEPQGEGDYFGFELEGPDRLFLLGDFTVTHNTIMLAALAQKVGGKQLVIQHRQELVDQNSRKYRMVNPKASVGKITAQAKTWAGDATFAMVQTLVHRLDSMPKIDLLIADECHHVAAPTWRSIIDAVRDRNPNALIAGFTATPERSDNKGLRGVFTNVCDTVTIRELVQMGFLVPPRGFVIDVAGTQNALKAISGTSDYFDQAEVEKILNTVAINDEVVRHWRERAGDRKTVVFCATVQHAEDVANAFRNAGVKAECVHGDLGSEERRATLARFDKGDVQVITNVMVLTEGFDSQPVSCVVLLRKCSAKGPLIQMVGRGLRPVLPEDYPGVVKKDCVVLDFGTSLLTHGDLNAGDSLGEDVERTPGEATMKRCPQKQSQTDTYLVPDSTGAYGCGAEIPCQCKTCPLCGFRFERPGGEDDGVTHVSLTEMDILTASPFRYVDLFSNGAAMLATGFAAWAGVFSADDETWTAMGRVKGERTIHRLADTSRVMAIASADDFLREHETDGSAKKTKRWLDQPASEKQLELLNRFGYLAAADILGDSGWTKYAAACHAEFQFNRKGIEKMLGV